MIPRSLLEYLRPMPNQLLVIRDEIAAQKAGLWLPSGYLKHTRSSGATILEVSEEAAERGWRRGQRVLLAAGAGKRFYLGYTSNEEIEVVSVSPLAILAVYPEEELTVLHKEEHHLRNFDGRTDLIPDDELKFDEGDKDGLR